MRKILLLIILVLFFSSLHIGSHDAKSVYLLARSITDRGEFHIDEKYSRYGARGRDGRIYVKYGLMRSIVAVPLDIIGKISGKLLSSILPENIIRETMASTTNVIITALTAFIIYRLFLLLGLSSKRAMRGGVLYIFSTIALQYSRDLMGEPLCGFFLILSFYLLLYYEHNKKIKLLWGAGLSFGLGMMTVSSSFIALPSFMVFLLCGIKNIKQKLINCVIFLAGLVIPAGIILFYNYSRFGSILESGYGNEIKEGFSYPFIKGIYGILFSPGKGLFILSPVFIMLFFSVKQMTKQHRSLVFTAVGMLLIYSCFYAKWYVWGSAVWGVRFLLPVYPFLFLLLMPFLAKDNEHPFKKTFNVIVVISVLFQLLSVLVNPAREKVYLLNRHPDWTKTVVEEKQAFSLKYSPLYGQVRSFIEIIKKPLHRLNREKSKERYAVADKKIDIDKKFSLNVIDIVPFWLYQGAGLSGAAVIVMSIVWVLIIYSLKGAPGQFKKSVLGSG